MTVLGDVLHVKHGFAFSGADFSEDERFPVVVTPGNFRIGGGFQLARAKTYTGSVPDGYVLSPGALIITMTDLSKAGDTLGSPALVPGGGTYLHNQRIGLVELTRPDQASLAYLAYRLRLSDYRQYIVGSASGTTVRHTSPGRIESFRLELPDVSTQRAIAEVLGALDDKIAANRELARASDELVRAMFERVDGQGKLTIGELFVSKRVAAKPPIQAEAYVGLEHVPRRSLWLDEVGASDGLLSGKFCFEPDDVLFGKLRPYFHKVIVSDRPGVCSTDILVLRAKRRDLRGFGWAAVSSDRVVERVSAMSEGTRMPRTSWADLATCDVPWPGEAAALVLSDQVVVIRDRVAAGVAESRHLAELRDTLLPHLMSGRLTVREAEKQVEEVL